MVLFLMTKLNIGMTYLIGKKLVHLDDLNVIINRYSEILNRNETKVVSHNGIRMLRVPANGFQIKLVDKSKEQLG